MQFSTKTSFIDSQIAMMRAVPLTRFY